MAAVRSARGGLAVGRVDAAWREWLVLNGMIGAMCIPIGLFLLTDAPLGAYTPGELPLTLMFGNMVPPLRFCDAVAFSGAACAAALVAVTCKRGLPGELRFAFPVQFVTATAFTLYANWRTERRRCEAYLTALSARPCSEAAEREAERLNDVSETVVLTGLPNRRHLDRRLIAWCAERQTVALAMLDVDHFRLYNDTLGRPAGDEALVARYCGEEFTAVLRGADPLQTARLAARLVRAVEGLGIAHPGRCDGVDVVTISAGIALREPGSATPPAELFAAVDGALYEAKRRGRNRYALADAPALRASA